MQSRNPTFHKGPAVPRHLTRFSPALGLQRLADQPPQLDLPDPIMDRSSVVLTIVLAIALALRILTFAVEIRFHHPNFCRWLPRLPRFSRFWLHLPVLIWATCAITNAVHVGQHSRHACVPVGTEENLSLNPDIGGLDIRVSFYITHGATFLSLVLGRYHAETGGAKELGIVQLLCKSAAKSPSDNVVRI